MTDMEAKSPATVTARRKRLTSNIGIASVQIGLLVAILMLWQFLVTTASLLYFSRPTIIISKLYQLLSHRDIYRHISVTLVEIAIGYMLGAAFGLSLGFVLGRSRFLSAALQPYIIGLYSIPKIALAPVFIVWLGLGIASKVAVVFVACFFLVFFNTYAGLLAVNEELVRLARLMGASWPQTLYRVIVP